MSFCVRVPWMMFLGLRFPMPRMDPLARYGVQYLHTAREWELFNCAEEGELPVPELSKGTSQSKKSKAAGSEPCSGSSRRRSDSMTLVGHGRREAIVQCIREDGWRGPRHHGVRSRCSYRIRGPRDYFKVERWTDTNKPRNSESTWSCIKLRIAACASTMSIKVTLFTVMSKNFLSRGVRVTCFG